MIEGDSLHRFVFEGARVRGELARLDASWQAVLARHAYPPSVLTHLGQSLAACVLLSATIKFEGSLILQIQSEGPLRTLVAQATHRRDIRGLARWSGEVPVDSLPAVCGLGHLILTLAVQGADPYQGIVELQGGDLKDTIEGYFSRSEQLPTRLWLTANEQRATGLLLQELPCAPRPHDDWKRIVHVADTLSESELRTLPSEQLLTRLFHQESVRLFDPERVSFHCGCSRNRIEETLRLLGHAEMITLLEERGVVEVDCEFCNRRYVFDAVDIERLFVPGSVLADLPPIRH